LKQSGLVEETHPEFDARVRVYALKDRAMAELKRWLADTEGDFAKRPFDCGVHLRRCILGAYRDLEK
jgi:hypothetical protein